MRQICIILLVCLSCLLTGCRGKEASELQVYTYNDTVYAMVSQGDSQLYFEAKNTLPEGAVILDPKLCKDSLKKVPILYFNTDMSLPVPTNDEEIATRINDTLMRIALDANCFTEVKEWPKVYRSAANPEVQMKELHDGLIPLVFKYMRGLPYVSPYIFSVDGEIPLLANDILTYRLDFSQYISGAAHGYYFAIFKVFNLKTGKPMQESDVFNITPANVKAINKLLRESFNNLCAHDTTGKYNSESCWIPDSMVMNGNFGVLEDGIVYHYDPYEVGCYAAGDLDLKVLSYKLEPYMNKKGIVYKYWHKNNMEP